MRITAKQCANPWIRLKSCKLGSRRIVPESKLFEGSKDVFLHPQLLLITNRAFEPGDPGHALGFKSFQAAAET
jgi:hypothetical protein